MNSDNKLRQLLAHTKALLLDFDGPICSVFADYPAPKVAAELRALLIDHGVSLPAEVAEESDPLEVLRWTGSLGQPEVLRATEDALCAAELRAVESATPTPYAREVIVAAYETGRPVAIVSNNSEPAIRAYLARHQLDRYISAVIGRAYCAPDQMKPNPEPILRASIYIGASASTCLLIGDSLADLISAEAAEVPAIGYANKPQKLVKFRNVIAQGVIFGMDELALAISKWRCISNARD